MPRFLPQTIVAAVLLALWGVFVASGKYFPAYQERAIILSGIRWTYAELAFVAYWSCCMTLAALYAALGPGGTIRRMLAAGRLLIGSYAILLWSRPPNARGAFWYDFVEPAICLVIVFALHGVYRWLILGSKYEVHWPSPDGTQVLTSGQFSTRDLLNYTFDVGLVLTIYLWQSNPHAFSLELPIRYNYGLIASYFVMLFFGVLATRSRGGRILGMMFAGAIVVFAAYCMHEAGMEDGELWRSVNSDAGAGPTSTWKLSLLGIIVLLACGAIVFGCVDFLKARGVRIVQKEHVA